MNNVLVIVSLALLLLGWKGLFGKTVRLIRENKQLSVMSQKEKEDLSYDPAYLKEYQRALSRVMSHYSFDSAKWKNGFWLRVSSAAESRRIRVSYIPEDAAQEKASGIERTSITFSSDYKNLVAFLDSVERIEGSGYLTSLHFEKRKNLNSPVDKDVLFLKAVFSVLNKK